ncbi:MAG: YaiI/YqxD family protein [Magnetococcales bacterium]|nr:YaiI/YqxD family protein [Magnetococcales bacterium]
MVKIYVDADACPVKEETVRVAERHELTVFMVSNQWMRLPSSRVVRQKLVGAGADKADDWIAEQVGDEDIVITADIPLASRCLAKNSLVLGPSGRPFDEEGIGMALAMRELHAHLRETGDFKSGGGAFSKKDRSRFLSALEEGVRKIQRAKR